MAPADLTRDFAVLLVCTGNVCRSPVAECLFAGAMGPFVHFESVGTGALVGEPIDGQMSAHLKSSFGTNYHVAARRSDRFAARQLADQHIRMANLVLTMTRNHRAAVVDMWPSSVRRSFTLREFARLLLAVNAEELPRGNAAVRMAAAVPLAAAQRRQVCHDAGIDDIADPYRRSQEDYGAAFHQIQDAVATITNKIVSAVDLGQASGGARTVL